MKVALSDIKIYRETTVKGMKPRQISNLGQKEVKSIQSEQQEEKIIKKKK